MAEDPLANGTQAPDSNQPDNGGESSENKGDLNIAVHQARQEAKLAKERAEKLEQEIEEIKLKSLPEDEQVEQGFIELARAKVMNKVSEDEINLLPSAIKTKLADNPWAFVSEETIKRETKFAESKKEYYDIVSRLAVESIKEIVGSIKPGDTQQKSEEKPDPSINNTNSTESGKAYTQAELMVLAQKDPDKFAEIRRGMQR